MPDPDRLDLSGRTVLITGGATGIGAAVARRLAATGASITLADVNDEAAEQLAGELGAGFVHADVSRLEDNERAMSVAAEARGGLDLVHLNAGLTTGFGLGEDFDTEAYRRVMGVNLDGVVYGIHAALPWLRGRPSSQLVVTASLAGLTAVPGEPIYAANKHALVGLVRSLGLTSVQEHGVRINALCPGFADTSLIDPIRGWLSDLSIPLIEVETVVDAFMDIVTDERSGECWFVQPGRPTQPFDFRRIPGPRSA